MCLGRESSYPPRDLANRALSSTTLVFLVMVVIMVVAAAVTLDHQGCTACPSSRAQGRPPFLGEAVHLLREDWFVRFQGVEGGEERGRRPGELLKRTQVCLCLFLTSANQRAFPRWGSQSRCLGINNDNRNNDRRRGGARLSACQWFRQQDKTREEWQVVCLFNLLN